MKLLSVPETAFSYDPDDIDEVECPHCGSPKVASNTSVTGFLYVTAMLKGLSVKD